MQFTVEEEEVVARGGVVEKERWVLNIIFGTYERRRRRLFSSYENEEARFALLALRRRRRRFGCRQNQIPHLTPSPASCLKLFCLHPTRRRIIVVSVDNRIGWRLAELGGPARPLERRRGGVPAKGGRGNEYQVVLELDWS